MKAGKMPSQLRMDALYMGIANHIAKMSYAKRAQVGAVIVKGDNIISMGWNGTPAGDDNACEDKEYMDRGAGGWLNPDEIEATWPYVDTDGKRYRLVTKKNVLHAESNALLKLLACDHPVSTTNATLYVTLSPCSECAKLIKQAKISRVVYLDNYRDTGGVKLLSDRGVAVEQFIINEE